MHPTRRPSGTAHTSEPVKEAPLRPECAYHQFVLADPDLTWHDINLAVEHGIDCIACGRIAGALLTALVSRHDRGDD
jgi:hypothetical protein